MGTLFLIGCAIGFIICCFKNNSPCREHEREQEFERRYTEALRKAQQEYYRKR